MYDMIFDLLSVKLEHTVAIQNFQAESKDNLLNANQYILMNLFLKKHVSLFTWARILTFRKFVPV